MERNGEPIWGHPLRRPVDTGIVYGRIWPDVVPEFEAREAAVYCHYTPEQFGRMDYRERAKCIAQYRLRMLIDNHIQDAAAEAAERRAGHGK